MIVVSFFSYGILLSQIFYSVSFAQKNHDHNLSPMPIKLFSKPKVKSIIHSGNGLSNTYQFTF